MTDKHFDRDFSDFSLEKKEKAKAYAPPPERDTACAEVTYGNGDGDASFKIPSRSADAGVPPATVKKFRTQDYSRRGADYSAVKKKSPPPGKAEERVLFEYRGSGYVRYISVKSWRSSYTFYDKFVKDALISHEQKGVKSPRVPFFAYIPQYTQLTTGAYAFYQYMKEQIRQGARLNDVDFSYVEGRQVLRNGYVYAKPGQKVAFVGATGAGKTTITNLINRFPANMVIIFGVAVNGNTIHHTLIAIVYMLCKPYSILFLQQMSIHCYDTSDSKKKKETKQ